jgi:hypothetical protein
LPTEYFWQEYPYIDGDFYYQFKDDGILKNERTRSLLYFIYDDETYMAAKEAMLNTVPTSSYHNYTYNNYVFMENLTLALHCADFDVSILGESAWDNHFSKDGESLRFPNHSTMICYCDDKNLLMFLGLELYGESYISRSELLCKTGDIESFLKEFFPFYDFDA